MLNESRFYCPECDDGRDHPQESLPTRRGFLRTVGGSTVALVAGGVLSTRLLAAERGERQASPAEALVRELHASLSESQRAELVHDWDHRRADGVPTRLCTFNSPVFGQRIGDAYTPAQQDLVRRVLRAILADDESLERLSRHDTWDASGSFEGCGAVLFGDPTSGPFSWVFAGHHLTVRCDGDSEPGVAFGGPMYYGHSANGYSNQNVFLYQTQQVHEVFDALDPEQRENALAPTNPGDGEPAIQFRASGERRPGVAYRELSPDQQQLVERVMQTLLAPFRPQDGEEVMQLIRVNGGLEKIHLSFFRDGELPSRQRWDVWRLEGPGFVWNFRVLPHVHCFVNIAAVS